MGNTAKKILIALLVAAMTVVGFTACTKTDEEGGSGVVTLKPEDGSSEETAGEEATGTATEDDKDKSEILFTEQRDEVIVTVDWMNIRSNTKIAAENIYTAVPKGTKLTRTGVSENWSRISFEGGIYYVSNKCIRLNVTDFTELDPAQEMYVLAEALNVRMDPDADSASVGSVKKGDRVTVVAKAQSGNWVRIQFNDGEYYVNGRYLGATESDTVAAAPQG